MISLLILNHKTVPKSNAIVYLFGLIVLIDFVHTHKKVGGKNDLIQPTLKFLFLKNSVTNKNKNKSHVLSLQAVIQPFSWLLNVYSLPTKSIEIFPSLSTQRVCGRFMTANCRQRTSFGVLLDSETHQIKKSMLSDFTLADLS